MQRILLTHGYFLSLDKKQQALGLPYPPLGTLYGASWLRGHGFEVSVFDTQFCTGPEEIEAALDAFRPDQVVILDDGFNYLTKMCLTNMREAAWKMIGLSKRRGCRVLVSGSDATDHAQQYLEAGADAVLIGEAEQTLLETIRGDEDVPGLAYLSGGKVVRNAPRAVMKDLDALPFPAWDLVDLEPYRRTWLKHVGYFSLNMTTTRGCPFKCNWCAKPIYGNRYHSRSVENVVEELKALKDRYAFDHIWFCDDIFGLKPGWVEAFADEIEKSGLRFRFKIQSRADLLVQPDYARALARAGCENAWMGAESGSQKILDAMDKGITVEQIGAARRTLKACGIRASFFLQFGYLGETGEDIRKTIRMIQDLTPDEIGISVSYPLPGTKFYDKVREVMSSKANWTESGDLALMFRNTYSPGFYKRLCRYVHRRYKSHLALNGLKLKFSIRKAGAWAVYAPLALLDRLTLLTLEKRLQ